MALSIDTTTYRSPNYDRHDDGRPVLHEPIGVVLHSGGGTKQSDLGWLTNPKSGVSAHFYVDRAGQIFQLMPEEYRAWHAGRASFGGVTDWNRAIGVELEHTAGVHTDYPVKQKSVLRALCLDIIERHKIPEAFIQSHRAIAIPRGRKDDPSGWDEASLRRWVAALYLPVVFTYIARHTQAIFEAPRPDAQVALNDTACVVEGARVEVDEVKFGWAHLASGLGFVPVGVLSKVGEL